MLAIFNAVIQITFDNFGFGVGRVFAHVHTFHIKDNARVGSV